jgi:excisionase family DNA binding protein
MKDIYHTTQATATKLNVSVRTVYRLIEEGKLKSVKRGKSHFFRESDINKLIEKGW